MSRLQDQVILVTGSTTGIGKAIALRCLREGACVFFHGLERPLAEALELELRRAESGDDIAAASGDGDKELSLGPADLRGRWAIAVEDLGLPGACQRLVKQAADRFGRLTGLVNNAASIPFTNLETTDEELFMQTLRINTLAPFLLIQAALPYLAADQGSVVNIGSVNSYCGEPNLLPYSVSKGGLTTLTRNLGDVLMQQSRVRVNQINPGWVLTENEQRRKQEHGLGTTWEAELPRVFAPAGRIFRPAEIAAVVVLLLSTEGGPISGQVWDLEQYPMVGRNPPKDATTAVR